MDDADIAVRNLTYQRFVALGRAPTVAEMTAVADRSESEVSAAWGRLHDAHAIVLHPDTVEIRMANPFSAVPTSFRVHAGGRSWDANCAWDAFGICAALQTDGDIEATCPDCGERLECAVRDRRPTDEQRLFHCLIPAKQWWDDIVFT